MAHGPLAGRAGLRAFQAIAELAVLCLHTTVYMMLPASFFGCVALCLGSCSDSITMISNIMRARAVLKCTHKSEETPLGCLEFT